MTNEFELQGRVTVEGEVSLSTLFFIDIGSFFLDNKRGLSFTDTL